MTARSGVNCFVFDESVEKNRYKLQAASSVA
jgi:hypothetical protein